MAYRVLCKQRDLCRIASLLLVLTGCILFLSACSFPGSVKPTVKIGLSAPFEGRDRDLGYEVLHAVRLAVRQRNEAGGVGERYLVELVALNDFNEPEEAILQAREMAVDRDVLGVLGGWSSATFAAAAPEYRRLGLAFLSAAMDWSQASDSAPVFEDPAFVTGYQALSGGSVPGPAADWAFAEANRLLDAVDVALRVDRQPLRVGVRVVLAQEN